MNTRPITDSSVFIAGVSIYSSLDVKETVREKNDNIVAKAIINF